MAAGTRRWRSSTLKISPCSVSTLPPPPTPSQPCPRSHPTLPADLYAERPLPWLPFGQEVGPESCRSDSRIVHEDVDVTEPIDGSLHEPLALIVPGNIPLKREHPVGRAAFLDELRQERTVHRGRDHICAIAQQGRCHGLAQVAIRARHERDFSIQAR